MKHSNILLVTFLNFVCVSHAQQAIGILNSNDVHCNVSSTGDLFNTFNDATLPGFEVPGGSGLKTIYAGNLWVGGITFNQTLKLAAEQFQANGADWFCGPLTTDGSASTTAQTQLDYNQVWMANAPDVAMHQLYYDLLNSGQSTETVFPNGYIIPQWMTQWPAHGDISMNQSFYLAPFFDYNINGVYDVENGDYPLFCGEHCAYFIFNDKGGIHTESGAEAIGLEVHGMMFTTHEAQNEAFEKTVFVKYKIINRGTQTLIDSFIGIWLDLDIGNPSDDYVATDVQNGAVIALNGDALDEESFGSSGYGSDLPSQAMMLLQGPFQDADNFDNPLTTTIIHVADSIGVPYEHCGIGYGDGIIDNEQMGLRRTIYYNNNSNSINGTPISSQDYFNYLRGIWKNGQQLSYSGDGTAIDSIPSRFVYPGESDPLMWGTQGEVVQSWSELNAGNLPGDRRMIMSSGPFTIEPGETNYFDVAFVFARESDDGIDDNVGETLEENMNQVRQYFNGYLLECNQNDNSNGITQNNLLNEISIFPNPVTSILNVEFANRSNKARLQFYDVTGHFIMSTNISSNSSTIDVASLTPGFYSVRVLWEGRSEMIKLVKK